MSEDMRPEMVRTSSFDEMPYDESLYEAILRAGEKLEPGPQRDQYRTLSTTIMIDLHRGGLVVKHVREAILAHLEAILDQEDVGIGASRIGPEEREYLEAARTKLRWAEQIQNAVKIITGVMEEMNQTDLVVGFPLYFSEAARELLERATHLRKLATSDRKHYEALAEETSDA